MLHILDDPGQKEASEALCPADVNARVGVMVLAGLEFGREDIKCGIRGHLGDV